MPDCLTHLRAQFCAAFDAEPWYGKSLMLVLEEVPVEKAYRHPAPGSRSIVEILLHMLAWRDFFLKRLRGEHPPRFAFDSPEDWPPQPDEHSIAYWNALKEKFRVSQRLLLAELDRLSPADLDADFDGSGHPLAIHLDGAIQHDIYHTGQIALLKNL